MIGQYKLLACHDDAVRQQPSDLENWYSEAMQVTRQQHCPTREGLYKDSEPGKVFHS
jgi:hypothetical protein